MGNASETSNSVVTQDYDEQIWEALQADPNRLEAGLRAFIEQVIERLDRIEHNLSDPRCEAHSIYTNYFVSGMNTIGEATTAIVYLTRGKPIPLPVKIRLSEYPGLRDLLNI